MAVQYSRGCPFNCEFCDIIVMNGRIPRTKTPEQFIDELTSLYNSGWRGTLFVVDDNFIGDAYGVPTKEGLSAIKLVAKLEGLFLDPVYTGKAMSGLISYIEAGKITKEDTVVFIHTGGMPLIFAYYDTFVDNQIVN